MSRKKIKEKQARTFKLLSCALLLPFVEESIKFSLLLLLYHLTKKLPKEIRYRPGIDHRNFSSVQFFEHFRFQRSHLIEIFPWLGIPERIELSNRAVAPGFDAPLLLLKRLSYPCRLTDLSVFFGKSESILSMTINFMLALFDSKFSHFLVLHENCFSGDIIKEYATAIWRKGCPLLNCVGFIDGTLIEISRPGHLQKSVYSGHKRTHGLKFQSVITPSGKSFLQFRNHSSSFWTFPRQRP